MDLKVDSNTAVIFDLDDTLYKEIEFLKSAYQEIAISLQANDWKSLYSKMISLYRNGENVFNHLASEFNVQNSTLLDTYRDHKPELQLAEGADTLFAEILANNGKLGIITDGRSRTQRNKIKALGLLEMLDCLVISEEIGTEKPSELNFRYVEKKLDLTDYYYIGDNPKKDFIAPNSLGWKTIGLIDNGLNIHHHSHLYRDGKHKPAHLITSFLELNIL